MAHFETVMDVGQEFWTIKATRIWRGGVEAVETEIKEHCVEEIRIYDTDSIGYVYDLFYDECYSEFYKEDIGTKIFLTRADAELALSLATE